MTALVTGGGGFLGKAIVKSLLARGEAVRSFSRQAYPELDVLGPLVGNLQLIRIHSGILVVASMSTAVKVTCNRCLEPIAAPVRFTVEDSYRPLTDIDTGRYIGPEEFEGTTEDLEDEALLIDEHHILDVSEIVRQNIWLALPMYPSCNWTGEGECPNWMAYLKDVQETEGIVQTKTVSGNADDVDPRWAALLNLQKQLEDEE